MNRLIKKFLLIPIILVPAISIGQQVNNNHFGFSSSLPLNPDIQSMIDAVSPDSIEYYLNSLVGFHTRHSNSDTTSDSIGIGAARRWIHSNFKAWANAPGVTNTTPGYFIFDRTICDVTGSHRNVTELIEGNLYPDRKYIIMGHMDSRMQDRCDPVSFAPGANDDGSGTAVVMELARILSQYEFESSFLLMPVTGEDQGLHGSSAYADYALANNLNIAGVLTNDVVGNIIGTNGIIDSSRVRHFSGEPDAGPSRQLTRYIKLKAESYDSNFTITLIRSIDRPGRSGDHIPFYNNGYPAVRFTEPNENGDGTGNNGRQHNEFDLVEFMNMGYVANITKSNIAAFATLALAPIGPESVVLRQVGDGTSVRLDWDASNSEPDFSGYRVAMRQAAETFYFDIIDVGNVDSIIVTGLTTGEEVYFSISAYDNAGNESVFSPEKAAIPSVTPLTPLGFDIVSTLSGPTLSWLPNSELDIAGYDIFRADSGSIFFISQTLLPHAPNNYIDTDALPGELYFYKIGAVDVDGIISGSTEALKGRKATFDREILIIDGSKNGTGGFLRPTDEEVDLFYERITEGFVVTSSWDIEENNALSNSLSDADLVPYSTLIIHSDAQGSSLKNDEDSYIKYLNEGGKILLSGWALSQSLSDQIGDSKSFDEKSIFNLFHIDSILTSSAADADFINPLSAHVDYQDMRLDSLKIPIFDNHLLVMDAFVEPFLNNSVEVLYSYNSSLGDGSDLNGKPVATRYSGVDYSYVLLDIPLYYMNEEDAKATMRTSLEFLNEPFVSVDEEKELSTIPISFKLGNPYPNPFNPVVKVPFDISIAGDLTIIIYDILGRKIRQWEVKGLEPGRNEISWDGKSENEKDSVSGMYLMNVTYSSHNISAKTKVLSAVRKLVLLR